MKTKFAAVLSPLVLAAVLIVGAPGPAQSNAFQAVSQAGTELLTLTQQLTQGTLLVALDIDKDESMKRLAGQTDRFEQRLKGLRDGGPQLAPSQAWPAALDERLDRIEFLWGQFRDLLQKIQKTGQASDSQIETAANLEVLLEEAIRSFVRDFDSEAPTEYYSLYLITVNVARDQTVLSQKMFKEFLYVAYQYQDAENKRNLIKSYSRLDRSFQALIHGDSELQLIPAPTDEVKRRWNEAREIWTQFRSIVKTMADSGEVEGEQITEVAGHSIELLKAMNNAVQAYESRLTSSRP